MAMNMEELQNAYDALKRIHDSMNQAYTTLEQEHNRIKTQNAILTAEKNVWEVEKAQQQMIIQQSLAQSNNTSNLYLEENRRLKEEIKLLKSK